MIDAVENDNNITDRAECDRNIDLLAQMFEQYDRNALADILQANGGKMDETTSLLLFQSEAQNKISQVEHSVDEGEDQMTTSQLISLDDKLVAQKMQEESGIISSSQSPPIQLSPETRRGPPVSSSEKTKRGEMISLPSDFLRPPGWISAEEKNIKNQVDEDERLAILLQNKAFLAEHPEVLSRDTAEDNPGASNVKSVATIMNGIKTMGKNTKHKLNELMLKWNITNSENNTAGSEEPPGRVHQ
eukprot:195355_1